MITHVYKTTSAMKTWSTEISGWIGWLLHWLVFNTSLTTDFRQKLLTIFHQMNTPTFINESHNFWPKSWQNMWKNTSQIWAVMKGFDTDLVMRGSFYSNQTLSSWIYLLASPSRHCSSYTVFRRINAPAWINAPLTFHFDLPYLRNYWTNLNQIFST